MKKYLVALVCMLMFAPAAFARVANAAPEQLTLEYKASVKAPPAKTWAALIDIAHWWSGNHTYSGSADNLALDVRAGGCWCEKLADGGGVQHMTVLMAMPGKMLRLGGGLGPLQSAPVNGVMTWKIKPVDSGSEIAMSYLVAGSMPGGLDKVAAGVDQVLSEQFDRLQRLIDTGTANAPKK